MGVCSISGRRFPSSHDNQRTSSLLSGSASSVQSPLMLTLVPIARPRFSFVTVPANSRWKGKDAADDGQPVTTGRSRQGEIAVQRHASPEQSGEKVITLKDIRVSGLKKRSLFRPPDPFAVITVDGTQIQTYATTSLPLGAVELDGEQQQQQQVYEPVQSQQQIEAEADVGLDLGYPHEGFELPADSELPSDRERGTTIRDLVGRLNRLFCEEEKWHTELSARPDSAQWLLDLLQDLLDDDANITPADRRLLSKALIRLSDYSMLYPRCFTLDDLEHERLVAGGSFSDVYTGCPHGQRVAVKMMRVFEESDIDAVLKGFSREAVIWRQLSHPNLLPFYGLYKFRQRLCLVSPWMENGHVRAFLKKQSSNTELLLSLVLDVALGLEHLHAQDIIHGDLKGDNIFVTCSLRACIADFGLSSFTASASSVQFAHSSMPSRGGTARYQAPEVLRGGRNGRRTDVYSWACVVYELFAGTLPFPEMSSDIAVVMAILAGQRPNRLPALSGSGALDGLWALLQECWHATPENRPTAGQIVQRLKGDGIGARESTQSENDWDQTSTSKFRHRLLGDQPLPTVEDFERAVFGSVLAASHGI
ncbi:kinase-like domain-containing protein [Roridomyces roridus]|uniref:Kinase-like domain-containing protein n=1 Tax=Roridomyces roridus TaxID=1738132 RepID=A0AAD7CKU2_9AGAR|nr:kinase-like domain-containing protein [Roridomyces roridus]